MHDQGAVPARPGLEGGRACGALGGSGGMSGVCTHVSACTRTRLCGAQVPMVTVQQPGRARRCQSRGKGRPVPPHCQARCRLVPLQGAELERLSRRHSNVRRRPAGAGAGRQGPRGFKAQGRKPKQQKSRRDRMRGESWLPARRWRGAVQVQSHSGAWAGTQCRGQNFTNLTGGSLETASSRPTNEREKQL